jgi:hypothetical protein
MQPARRTQPAVPLEVETERERQNARRSLMRAIRGEAAHLRRLTQPTSDCSTATRPRHQPRA